MIILFVNEKKALQANLKKNTFTVELYFSNTGGFKSVKSLLKVMPLD